MSEIQTAKRLRILAPAPTPMPINARILKQQHAKHGVTQLQYTELHTTTSVRLTLNLGTLVTER